MCGYFTEGQSRNMEQVWRYSVPTLYACTRTKISMCRVRFSHLSAHANVGTVVKHAAKRFDISRANKYPCSHGGKQERVNVHVVLGGGPEPAAYTEKGGHCSIVLGNTCSTSHIEKGGFHVYEWNLQGFEYSLVFPGEIIEWGCWRGLQPSRPS